MKIDVAINSSNSNSFYLDFWPSVSKAWRRLNINPILLYIEDNESINISEEYGNVIRIKPIPRFSISLQCQIVRYWYATQLGNKIGIISDIDMYPLSNFYFNTQLEQISNDKYVHINPCANNIPACYHIASGNTYSKVLGNVDFDMYIDKAIISSNGINTNHDGNEHWSVDEVSSTMLINNYEYKSLFHFIQRDGGQNGHRIDRSTWRYDRKLVSKGYYYDIHSVRPYSKYNNELNKIFNLL
jgi:hypothetical protein